jgi:hypothetical protein
MSVPWLVAGYSIASGDGGSANAPAIRRLEPGCENTERAVRRVARQLL